VSDIMQIKYGQQPAVFPFPADGGFTPEQPLVIDLEDHVISVWTGFEAGGPVVGTDTLHSLVQTAIQQQSAGASLNSLNWGDQAGIAYSAGFVAPPPDAAFSGAGGTINIVLFVPGNSLSFTASGATFDVDFDLIVNVQLTLPVSLAPIFAGGPSDWSVGASATVEVEALSVTTHNVGVFLCDRSAVSKVLNAINGKVISIPNIVVSGLGLVNGLIEAAWQAGCTQLLQTDDGTGNLVLTAVSPTLTINGSANDTIKVDAIFHSVVVMSAQGQEGSIIAGPLSNITVIPSSGTNSIMILGLPARVAVDIGIPKDSVSTVTVGGPGGLGTLAGTTVNVSDTTGATELIVDDSAGGSERIAQITSNSISFTDVTTVNYGSGVTAVKVLGGAGNDQFFIPSVAASLPTTLDTGPGDNAVFVGVFTTNPATAGTGEGSVAGLAGALSISDNAGDTSLIIDASGRDYDYFQVYGDHVTFTAGPTIDFTPAVIAIEPTGYGALTRRSILGVNHLTIYGSFTGNNFQVSGVDPLTGVIIWGTANDIAGGAALDAVTRSIYPPGDGEPVAPVRLLGSPHEGVPPG
jgi:hypothetical protein